MDRWRFRWIVCWIETWCGSDVTGDDAKVIVECSELMTVWKVALPEEGEQISSGE